MVDEVEEINKWYWGKMQKDILTLTAQPIA